MAGRRDRRTAAATTVALVTALTGLVVLPSSGGSAESPSAAVTESPALAIPDRIDAPRQVREVTPAFSDPEWYPLREPAWISCARTNCTVAGKPYHGYWAQDWTGEALRKQDPDEPASYDFTEVNPVYAAGSGRVEIVRNERKCGPDQGSSEGNGTILQIDHGGGVYSVYKHLEIEVAEGEWVTPTTRIGKMAAWGSEGCNINYLHFEIVVGNNRRRVPFDDLKACRRERMILPDDLTPYDDPDVAAPPVPYEGWDDVTPYFTERDPERSVLEIPTMNDDCIPSSFPTPATPARPRATAGRPTSVVVSLPKPVEGVGGVMLARQVRFPSGIWSDPVWSDVPVDTTRLTVEGLSTGRTYRFTVAHRNREGWSQWSNGATIVVGAVPKAPYAPKRLTVASTAIGMAWERAEAVGYPVTGYRLQIRRETSTGWTEWETVNLTTETFYRFYDLTPRRNYQLRVRALSAIGPSPFSDVVSVTTPRS